ncbi:MAG: SpoIIE family protein phosphatase, partial [Ignavibacteria bacterium]|nr:SpoIIE family protein phosphatase [Ignavibacteria bacterium]
MPPQRRQSRSRRSAYESYFDHAALFEFSKVINSSLDPRFVYSHILLTIMGKTLSSRGMILLEQEPGSYVVENVKGFSPSMIGGRVEMGKFPKSLFYLEKVSPARYPWVKFFTAAGVKILLPMLIADRTIGLLGFGERFSRRRLHAREETFLRSLANIAATAVEKSRTVEEIQQVNRKLDRKIQELNTLFELGKEFGVLLDPDKLIRLLVFSLLGQVGVSRYLIYLREGPEIKVVASRIDGTMPQAKLLRMLADVKGPTLVSQLVVKQTVDPRTVISQLGLSVIVPMQMQGENKGILLLGDKLSGEPFDQADLDFVSSLANLAIISLENARLFKETIEKQKLEDELLIAREIQKGLLPSVLPTIPGIDIAASNISSKQVGGDYYDIISLSEHLSIIAIGDVSGKGPPAALLMANLQATIRALVPLDLPLSELTWKVNDLMCENTGGTKFVTFFWAVVDSNERSLTYVNAGHNYPYLFHEGDRFDQLDKGGMILGVMKTSIPYQQATVPLRAGDVLVMYTDGVTEAMNKESVEYGEERLITTVQECRACSAHDMLDAVYQDILRHVEG